MGGLFALFRTGQPGKRSKERTFMIKQAWCGGRTLVTEGIFFVVAARSVASPNELRLGSKVHANTTGRWSQPEYIFTVQSGRSLDRNVRPKYSYRPHLSPPFFLAYLLSYKYPTFQAEVGSSELGICLDFGVSTRVVYHVQF